MDVQVKEVSGVRLAIEGCGHGTLHDIYASITEACQQKGWPGVDLLIIGGDFQSVRNAYDLNCVSMPARYRSMCDFHEYYSGQRTAPYLTIFVGGNHEASNYLFELYYGGWVAPNIYYMGAANVLRFGPLRIAAMSGIWKGYNYRKPHHERLPYNESDMKSVYHVRELDVRKLLQIRSQVDIGISHDWPKGVEWKGNWKQLFRFKKHFEEDARSGQLGSVAAQTVMNLLRPKWWFSAHLHCKYAAVVEHEQQTAAQQPFPAAGANGAKSASASNNASTNASHTSEVAMNEDEIELDFEEASKESVKADVQPEPVATVAAAQSETVNADEIDLELEDDEDGVAPVAPGQGLDNVALPIPQDSAAEGPLLSTNAARAVLPEAFRRPDPPKPAEHPPDIKNKTTRFLALDKCLPNRHFLQLMSIPYEENAGHGRPFRLQYDREWLSITRSFALDEPLVLGDAKVDVLKAKSQEEYIDNIAKRRLWVDDKLSDEDLVVPDDFEITAPVYDNGNWLLPQYSQVMESANPQTARFCQLLQIPNPFELSEEQARNKLLAGPKPDPNAGRDDRGRGRGGYGRGRGGDVGRGRGRGRGGGRGPRR